MINTLKNNGYTKMGSTMRWVEGSTGAIFDTAMDAYIHYLETCNRCMKNTEEYSDDEG